MATVDSVTAEEGRRAIGMADGDLEVEAEVASAEVVSAAAAVVAEEEEVVVVVVAAAVAAATMMGAATLLPAGITATRPCPSANGTIIGTAQEFVLLCGSNVVGDTLNTSDITDFTACVDLCSSFSPQVRSSVLQWQDLRAAGFLAVGQNTPVQENGCCCRSIRHRDLQLCIVGRLAAISEYQVRYLLWLHHQRRRPRSELRPDFQDCVGQCVATTGCGAVSFDASQAQGLRTAI